MLDFAILTGVLRISKESIPVLLREGFIYSEIFTHRNALYAMNQSGNAGLMLEFKIAESESSSKPKRRKHTRRLPRVTTMLSSAHGVWKTYCTMVLHSAGREYM